MKRLFTFLTVICLLLTLLSGCKSNEGTDLDQVTGGVGGDLNVNTPGDFNEFLEEDGEEEEQPQTPDQTPEEQPDTQTPETPDQTPGEQPGAETPETPEETPEEQPQAPVDYTTDDWITVCSYNVKVLYYDHNNDANGTPMSKFEAVCDELRKIDADVVGLQELDRFSNRSGANVDQLKELADALGYPYYYYTKTVPSGNGEYGHGIMSRYPIVSKNSYFFADYNIDAAEPRGFSRCELKVGNKLLVFYNTHLAGQQASQMMHITLMMEKDMERGKYAVLTGDMNAYPSHLNSSVDSEYCTLLNTVENPLNTTYVESVTMLRVNPIDNIVATNNLEHYWDADLKTGIKVVEASASDHLPIYTYVRMK